MQRLFQKLSYVYICVCMSLAGAAPYNSFKRVTNPHMFDLGGVLILGTSGQTVDDMAKYTRGQNR